MRLSKAIDCTVSPGVSCGLWETALGGFIHRNTRPTLVGDADDGGCACVGIGVHGESLHLLLSLATNLKLL